MEVATYYIPLSNNTISIIIDKRAIASVQTSADQV